MTREAPLPERIARTIRKHGMLEPDGSVLVGVSGGPDSICLLCILVGWCAPRNIRVAVAHVNHGWRGEDSELDAVFVCRLAADFGLKCHTCQIDPGVEGNLEDTARNARQRFMIEVAGLEGYQRIALGHTRDDRNETFFLNLLRGAGADGLAAMPAVSGRVIRPMIEAVRSDITTYLEGIGQTWREDCTNRDTGFARNDLRHRIFPLLAGRFNPKFQEALARTVDILEAENGWMEQTVSDWLASRVTNDDPDLVVRIDDLGSRPDAFIRRTLRLALRRAGSNLREIGFDHIENIRTLLAPGKSGRVIELPGPIGVERSFDSLRFFPGRLLAADYEYDLPIPGHVEVPEVNAVFAARLVDPRASETDKPNSNKVFVDGESLGPYVKIRNWKSGDSYTPDGLSASRLKTLFQKQRIPRRKRLQWPVLVAQSSIVWVTSFPVSRDFVPTGRSQRVVEFETSPL